MRPKSLERESSSRLRSGLAKSGKATVRERVPMPPHTHPQVIGAPWTLERWGLGGWGLALTPPRYAPPSPPARSPVARTHSAWVKALSPSGTAVSPFPEQSTRRSPSQLQGAAQRGGAAPLGPAEPSSPRARKQSSLSGPGIAAAAARARLSRGASRSARLGCPPPSPGAAGLPGSGPGHRPLAVRVRSLPSAVRRRSARTRRSAVAPFPLLHGRARAAPRLGGSGQPARPRAAAGAARCHRRRRLLSRASSRRTAPQGCGAQPPAMPARRPNPRPGSHKHPGCPRSPRRGSRSVRPFPF